MRTTAASTAANTANISARISPIVTTSTDIFKFYQIVNLLHEPDMIRSMDGNPLH